METDNFDTFRENGIQFFDKGNYKEAINCFNRCVELRPEDSAILTQRGIAKSHSGDGDGASIDFNRAMSMKIGFMPFYEEWDILVIIANINGASTLPPNEMSQLKTACKKMRIEKVVSVYSIDALETLLDKTIGQNSILFTNFPPDSSYPGSSKSISEIELEGKTYQCWEADSYSKSHKNFKRILMANHFEGVHFITAADENRVEDKFLKSLTSGLKITVQRKKEWMNPGMVFNQFYKFYMIEKVKDFENS